MILVDTTSAEAAQHEEGEGDAPGAQPAPRQPRNTNSMVLIVIDHLSTQLNHRLKFLDSLLDWIQAGLTL